MTIMLDMDAMTYNSSRHAVHRSVTFPESYTGSIVKIYTDDVHTGYVRLIREKDNTELQLSDVYPLRVKSHMDLGSNLHGGEMTIAKCFIAWNRLLPSSDVREHII